MIWLSHSSTRVTKIMVLIIAISRHLDATRWLSSMISIKILKSPVKFIISLTEALPMGRLTPPTTVASTKSWIVVEASECLATRKQFLFVPPTNIKMTNSLEEWMRCMIRQIRVVSSFFAELHRRTNLKSTSCALAWANVYWRIWSCSRLSSPSTSSF